MSETDRVEAGLNALAMDLQVLCDKKAAQLYDLGVQLGAARAALEEIAKAAGEMPSSAFEQHAHRIARAALPPKERGA